MKCLICGVFESWSRDELIRHTFMDHYIWEEYEEWQPKSNGLGWEKKKLKKIKFVETYEGKKA